ncbi:ABC transporter substrate-binding protein [Collimonas fungivorans]|uniref:glycine betaine ABC transporter substrate-binding protein OsmF n=1 Tax=Collimonas fungivorans TaxID=158899 RepID=UPI00077883BB|nr:ABC transporter substrate-binding protein [Collimonas fungivorans]
MSLYTRLLAAALATSLAAALLSPMAQAAEPVRVGSKIDTEGALLGNLVQLVLEANGIKTVNRLQLGTTKVVRGALISGEVDIYPEYTGNGAFFFSDEKNPAWKNAETGYQLVKKLDLDKNKLAWLTPSPANNTWLIAVRKDVAQANKLKTLVDLGRWISQGGHFKLAASAEFIERPDALPAFENTYGFKLKQDQLLTLAGGDTAATIKAAAEQTSGVNAAMVYGTDGALAALGLVALDDVKSVQPVYAPTAVIRAEVLAKYPKIADLLKPVFLSLDSPTLQKLNAGIAIEGRDGRKVAGDYLRSKGFIK